MTREEFDKIVDRATLVCQMKCSNSNVRRAINDLREARKENDMEHTDYLFETIRYRENHDCNDHWECRCSPDEDFMFKEINRIINKKK